MGTVLATGEPAGDVRKLCAGVERGGGHIRDCLASQKDKLSEMVESRGK
jgi:hypothetical protein